VPVWNHWPQRQSGLLLLCISAKGLASSGGHGGTQEGLADRKPTHRVHWPVVSSFCEHFINQPHRKHVMMIAGGLDGLEIVAFFRDQFMLRSGLQPWSFHHHLEAYGGCPSCCSQACLPWALCQSFHL